MHIVSIFLLPSRFPVKIRNYHEYGEKSEIYPKMLTSLRIQLPVLARNLLFGDKVWRFYSDYEYFEKFLHYILKTYGNS